MERALVLRNHLFGPNSIEVKASRKSVGELCNLLAMKNLEKNDFNSAIALLRKATILTKQNPLNLAVTYNNLAWYNRKQGKLRTALQFLQKALKIEERCGSDVKYPADTYLNICAVLSQLGRHQSALENAQSALILLHESAFKGNTDSFNIDKEKNVIRLDRIAVLAIAYYNIGVEQEFLKKDSCMRSYQKGSEVAQLYLGRDHLITIKLVKAHASAQSKYEPIMSTCNTEPNLSHNWQRELSHMRTLYYQ